MFVLQWEYKKDFEENKGMYHFDAEATEHLHHKGNATLQSQVSPLSAATLRPTGPWGCLLLSAMLLEEWSPRTLILFQEKHS